MATLCLAADFDDLKVRLGRIIIGYDYDGNPVPAADLDAKPEPAFTTMERNALSLQSMQRLNVTFAILSGLPKYRLLSIIRIRSAT